MPSTSHCRKAFTRSRNMDHPTLSLETTARSQSRAQFVGRGIVSGDIFCHASYGSRYLWSPTDRAWFAAHDKHFLQERASSQEGKDGDENHPVWRLMGGRGRSRHKTRGTSHKVPWAKHFQGRMKRFSVLTMQRAVVVYVKNMDILVDDTRLVVLPTPSGFGPSKGSHSQRVIGERRYGRRGHLTKVSAGFPSIPRPKLPRRIPPPIGRGHIVEISIRRARTLFMERKVPRTGKQAGGGVTLTESPLAARDIFPVVDFRSH